MILKFFKNLYLTHHKFSEGLDGFVFLFVKVFGTLPYVYVKNCNLDFGQTNSYLLYHVIVPLPCELIKVEAKKHFGTNFQAKNNFTPYFSIVLKLSSLFFI
jgi:hypothetical protein